MIRRTALAALACLGTLGCSEREPKTPDAGQATTAPAANINVPLPDGWSASVEADRSFRAGPAEKSVLRIDFKKGGAELMPSLEAMRVEFQTAAARPVEVREEVDEDGARLLYLALPVADGGQEPVLVGAKRAGGDLFLCSSLPGATEKEVHAAGEACRALKLSAP